MESKSSPITSKTITPIDSPKKDIVGVVSEETVTGIWSDLKEDSLDENGGGRVSKGDDGEVVRSPSVGLCRKCHITLDMDLDPKDGLSVVVDGCGLCEDCEYKRSIEMDPNWGRSRRISSEEKSCEEKWECSSDDEEVNSATPSKKKQ